MNHTFKDIQYMIDILEQDPKIRQRLIHNELLSTKIDCPCGGFTDKANKSRHEKTEKHKKYVESLLEN